MYSYYQLKMLPNFVKFANSRLARNIVSAKKLKILQLTPSLAIWPITLAKNENTETKEEKPTKSSSLWKLFSFEESHYNQEDDEDKSWFKKFFEKEEMSRCEEPLKKEEKSWLEKLFEGEKTSVKELSEKDTLLVICFCMIGIALLLILILASQLKKREEDDK